MTETTTQPSHLTQLGRVLAQLPWLVHTTALVSLMMRYPGLQTTAILSPAL